MTDPILGDELLSTYSQTLSLRVIRDALEAILASTIMEDRIQDLPAAESASAEGAFRTDEDADAPPANLISRVRTLLRRNPPNSVVSPTSDSRSPSAHSRSLRQTLGSWLRERSKLLPGGGGGGGGSDGDRRRRLRPWKKFCRSRRGRNHQRELPPLPAMPEVAPEEEEVARLALRMADMAPGTAFLPEGEDEEDGRPMESARWSSSCIMDFSKSLETVKNCGWYWGPISGDAAEKLLSEEPDGSFVVRDSSDDHYIFSLTFKLNGTVRHVRIEHDQGNFSFGTFTKFKSNTIVDFIENAVEHSRSGRYLFFLHRRPVLGPMRVQLLNPVSRFKIVQSLQHQCRFVILRHVPRDLLHKLPVPPKIQEYLNTPFYYSEIIADDADKYPKE